MKALRLCLICWLAGISVLLTSPAVADPVGTEFTYQGELQQLGAPANGAFDFEFNLFDVEIDGIALTAPYRLEDVIVQDGVFTVELDFGSDVFDGTQLWLGVAVRESASVAEYTPLTPWQKLTASPFALGASVELDALFAEVANLRAQVTALADLLDGVSRGTDPNTSQDTLTFSDMNVQIVNGTGATNSATGTGNLILGYNGTRDDTECPDGWECTRRTGSHMLVSGYKNNYTGWGGVVLGSHNETTGSYASVSGGVLNQASGSRASVSGGWANTASGDYASVSGGANNTASGDMASVSGGAGNQASGEFASVSGGYGNQASGQESSVSGGSDNQAIGNYASVLGGQSKAANNDYETVSGLEEPFFAHAGDSAAHHVLYADADAIDAVGPHFSGNHADLVNVTADQHHVRYADAEAVTAVEPFHFSGNHADLSNVVPNQHHADQGPSVTDLETLLVDVSRLTDPNTGQDTLRFSGMNMQIVNGTGATNSANGTGNLILGYNETRDDTECPDGWDCNRRTGSHMLVSGYRNNYTSWGGVVLGTRNETSGSYASVSGGYGNSASGTWASVSGGSGNTASGTESSVSGGWSNEASGRSASVSGGHSNQASGNYVSVSGGQQNIASGYAVSVSGGRGNQAIGENASVSGGSSNQAIGDYASVSGGTRNTVNGQYASVSGGTWNEASGYNASVSGGESNTASGDESSVSGGISNVASGSWASVSGGQSNEASSGWASVSGGLLNIASGFRSSVSGGRDNQAIGEYASVSGGYGNIANGAYESIVGGDGIVCDDSDPGVQESMVCGEGVIGPAD
jgi:hypothetical protein